MDRIDRYTRDFLPSSFKLLSPLLKELDELSSIDMLTLRSRTFAKPPPMDDRVRRC